MSVPPDEREAKQRSAAIDRQLRTDQREYENTIKILLLGELTLGGGGGGGDAGSQTLYC